MNRFLGEVDCEDPSNLPMGLGSVVRNSQFELTSVRTRDGFQLQMQLLDKAPCSGLLGMIYTPETAAETFFQLPIAFQPTGKLQYEAPVGSGNMVALNYDLFKPPAAAHMIAIQTDNRGYLAFTDLIKPLSQLAVFNPKTLNLDPYGMKPFGWTWLPSTQVLVGEVATPTTPGGNGHTYRCTVPGVTGILEPIWPLTESGVVQDGTATWEELTAVLANRLPIPATPVLTRDSGVGTFAAGRDVYIVLNYVNKMGDSLTSVPVSLTNTVANDGVLVALPTFASLPGWMRGLSAPYVPISVNVYEVDVATGANAPPGTAYQFYGNYPLGAIAGVLSPATSATYPPTTNTARVTPGQLPTPDVEPTIERVSTLGAFPVGRDVYVLQTYVNSLGETTAGPASSIIDTEADDAVQVTVAAPAEYTQIETIGIYEADVATGQPAPPPAQFALVGYYGPAATPSITASAAGPPPPTSNTTGPAGNIVADTETGGLNGGQGYRYAAIMYMNRNYSVSGFTQASVIQYIVDEDGWEIGIFNVATGPDNIIARLAAFAVADGSNAGPFYWIGNINPQIPSANFVYSQTMLSDQIPQSATVFYDNTTTTGILNFTDEYLQGSNDVTDRLRIIWPPQAVHVAYHKSVDRIFLTGLYGNWSGCGVSNGGAPEDFYGDTYTVQVGSDDGERSWGTIEYRQQSYLLRERSGLVMTANPSAPTEWVARGKWDQVGPCGPRAFDACDKFMIFVHRSGVYKFEDDVDKMSKEIPYFWQSINWAAAQTVCVKIDYETHQVQILLPVNGSPVPNIKLMLNFDEGWQNPIHYGVMSGKEIAMDAARKYSVDDCQAFVCGRIERALPAAPDAVGDETVTPLTDATFQVAQFMYGTSGPDGGVQASQPGTFDDNGSGIDWVYETVCPQATMAVSKAEGIVLNARGAGILKSWLLGARKSFYGQKTGVKAPLVLPIRDINLDIEQGEGISRAVPSKLNEKWRVRFTNGKTPGAWASLKWLAIYTIPMFNARDESERGG